MGNTRIIKIFEDRQKKIDLNEQETKDLLKMKDILGDNRIILQADWIYVNTLDNNLGFYLFPPPLTIRT